jgi:hypothetical protein
MNVSIKTTESGRIDLTAAGGEKIAVVTPNTFLIAPMAPNGSTLVIVNFELSANTLNVLARILSDLRPNA